MQRQVPQWRSYMALEPSCSRCCNSSHFSRQDHRRPPTESSLQLFTPACISALKRSSYKQSTLCLSQPTFSLQFIFSLCYSPARKVSETILQTSVTAAHDSSSTIFIKMNAETFLQKETLKQLLSNAVSIYNDIYSTPRAG